MRKQQTNRAATRHSIPAYAASNSTITFFSHCPNAPGQCSMSLSREAPSVLCMCEVEKAERCAFRLSVFVLPPDYFACGKLQIRIVASPILGFIRRMQTTTRHKGRRTSCVLFNRTSFRMPGCTTRLQGGFAPVDPHQRGDDPPFGFPPLTRSGGAI
jgi:hypothetical protein